jgi:hypothetical protein
MLIANLALFLFVILLGFIAAWRFMPAGWLTATTGSLGAVAVALYEAMGDMMPELKTLMPAEYRPWLVVVFMLLTVAARFRNRAVQP